VSVVDRERDRRSMETPRQRPVFASVVVVLVVVAVPRSWLRRERDERTTSAHC